MKKFLTFVLVLAMVLSVSSFAMADGEVAQIGETKYATLQEAIDNAVDGDTITLLANCTDNVTVVQKANVKFTIDGAGKTMTGMITVDGKSATILTAGVTIKNFNFDGTSIGADACIRMGDGTNATRYVCNLTVENCTFTGGGKVAIKSYTGGDYNLKVIGCTVDNTMHSLLQVDNVIGVVVDNCTVNSKNGINLNSSSDVEIKNSNIAVKGYAVRIGAGSGGASGDVELTNNTLATDNSEGDAAIVLRGAAVTQVDLDMTNNRVSGNTHISGNTDETTISADANYWDGKDAPVASGTAVPVKSYYSDAGLTNLVAPGAVAKIGTDTFKTLEDAVAAAQNGDTITLIDNIELSAIVNIPAGKTITLDLAGKTIAGTDTTDKNFGLINLVSSGANLTVKDSVGGGKITLKATINSGWNRYSAVIANNQGTLTIEGGTIQHLGGTDMAYGIDNLTNGGTTPATLNVKGGTISSTYRAIRQFANGDSALNTLNITGGTINGTVWLQSPNAKENMAELSITGGTINANEGANAVYVYSMNGASSKLDVDISGDAMINGPIKSADSENTNPVKNFISGGSFSEKPAAELVAANKVALFDDNVDRFVIGDKKSGASIHIAPKSLDFGSEKYGYDAVAAQSFVITNNGSISLTVPDLYHASYELIFIAADEELDVGESETFSVFPKANLKVGTYNADVAIKATYTENGATDKTEISETVSLKFEVTAKPRDSIKVKYEGGNSFSTSKSAVPTSVEIDGVPVPFTGNGKLFTVGCIDPDAEWVTVRWNSTSVTVNFKPDVTVSCPVMSIPKTGDMPLWMAVAEFFGF